MAQQSARPIAFVTPMSLDSRAAEANKALHADIKKSLDKEEEHTDQETGLTSP